MQLDLRSKVSEVKYNLMIGKLTYDQAKAELQPYLDEANKKGKAIAKKHGGKFNKLTFTYVMR